MDIAETVAELRLRIQKQDRLAREAPDLIAGAHHAEHALELRERLRAVQAEQRRAPGTLHLKTQS